MLYEEITQIENWFSEDEWHLTQREKEEKRNSYPNKFFYKHIPKFWEYLDIIDVINLALTYKYAAYQAYYHNIRGFKTFCTEVWDMSILNLTRLPSMNTMTLQRIQQEFRTREIIYPSYISEDVLKYLPRATKFTFYLGLYKPLSLPIRCYIEHVNLTIHGSNNFSLRDATINILFTFSRIFSLKLTNIDFNKITIAALGSAKIHNLTIENCFIPWRGGTDFIRALLSSKDRLHSINIESDNDTTWEETTQSIANNIISFEKLSFLNCTMKMNWHNANIMRKLNKSSTLQHVHITSNLFYSYYNDIEQYLKREIQKNRITTISTESRHTGTLV